MEALEPLLEAVAASLAGERPRETGPGEDA